MSEPDTYVEATRDAILRTTSATLGDIVKVLETHTEGFVALTAVIKLQSDQLDRLHARVIKLESRPWWRR